MIETKNLKALLILSGKIPARNMHVYRIREDGTEVDAFADYSNELIKCKPYPHGRNKDDGAKFS